MYHYHKPYKCAYCKRVQKTLFVTDGYYTKNGEGYLTVECPNCEYKLDHDELEKIGFFEKKK